MKDLTAFLSTAPVLLTLYLVFIAGLLIEINRLYPDLLFYTTHLK